MLKFDRAERMRRHHRRHGSRGGLNLVSLMDIFTILVFFLLVNSGDVDMLPASRDLTLPDSIAEQPARDAVTVTVTREDILVQGRRVAGVQEVLVDDRALIPSLVDALQQHAARARTPADGVHTTREVTIMGDRELPYSLLRRVMASCTAADYDRVSLAVNRRSGDAAIARLDTE